MSFLWFIKDTRIANYLTSLLLAGGLAYWNSPIEEVFNVKPFLVMWMGWTMLFIGAQEATYLIARIVVFIYKFFRGVK